MNDMEKFSQERERLNKIINQSENLVIKRFLNLDHNVYKEGALPVKTKELLGLTASIVLRCDDCISYHLIRCKEVEVTGKELEEAVAIALVIGGSITIPHIRRMMAMWKDKEDKL